MAKPFRTLLENMPQERRDLINAHTQELLLEMALNELRQKRHLTQQELAERLQMQQAAISKMENQSDMHIVTLQRIIAAMGGRLKLVAQFPDEEIVINQFETQPI